MTITSFRHFWLVAAVAAAPHASAQQRLEVGLDDLFALADEHYQVTHNRYGQGLALLTDILDASHTKLTADMELVNARISLLYNYYKLKYLTHTL